MNPLTASPTLADLAPVGLAELVDRAALQTRVDRKYLLTVADLPLLLDHLASYARVLEIDGERAFRYESVYFDTPGLVSYHCAAYRRRRRFKVRTRTYLDSAQCWLEVKISGARGSITKHRLPYQPQDRRTVQPGRTFVDETLTRELIFPAEGSSLEPTLVSSYRRSTLLLPQTNSRVTIDTDLRWQDGRHTLELPGLVVVETKTRSAAAPLDRMLWQRGTRPARISKYATGLAALRLDLPSTPWRRTLRRHFHGTAVALDPHSDTTLTTMITPSAATTTPGTTIIHRPEQEASCV